MMNNKFVYLILVSITVFICIRCTTDSSSTITIANNSSHNIGYYFALGGIYGTYYPDSLPKMNNYITYKMGAGKKIGVDTDLSIEAILKSLPKDTLSVFIFHTDTLNKYSWEEVRNGYKVLRRYDLSIQNIKTLNLVIPYPPTEPMKDMKMWPPYGSEK